MPNRVLREALLNSERYWSLSSDTCRMLFIHLVLRADDFGLFRAANYTTRATCFGLNAPSHDATAKMLQELNDADLVRLYRANGADYGIIPRFGQRLRIVKARYPLPPAELRDSDINDLISKMTDGCPTDVRHPSAEVKRSEVEVEVKRKEKKGSGVTPTIAREATAQPIKTVLENLKINIETEEERIQRLEANRQRQLAIVAQATKGNP